MLGRPSSDRFCVLNERSYVDPVTGLTFLAPVDLCRDLSAILAGDVKPHWLPTFLHELTHHWCVTSPLGSVLGLLRMRVQRLVARPNSSYGDLLIDQARYILTLRQLRPLSEGLALFAQFDVLPGNSPVISLPMKNLIMTFGRTEIERRLRLSGSPPPDNHTSSLPALSVIAQELLTDVRLDERSIESKFILLQTKFGTSDGGYLVGYITTKNWWLRLAEKCNQLADSDLFLCYLKAYFHDDLGAMSVVLKPTDDPIDLIQSIHQYFHERWIQLLTVTDEELTSAVAAFEHYMKRQGSGFSELRQIPGLLTDDRRSQIGQELLYQLADELDTAALDGGEPIAQAQHKLWQQRDLLCVGSTPGRVFCSNGSQISISCGFRDTEGSGIVALKQLCDPSAQDVQIEYYLSPVHLSHFMVVAQEHKVIACSVLNGDKELVGGRVNDLLFGHQVLVGAIDKLEKAVNQVINGQQEMKYVLDLLESKSSANAAFEYKKWALFGMLNHFTENWPSHPSVKMLEKEGFWQFCKSARALKALARVSAALADDQSLQNHSDDVLDRLAFEEINLGFWTLDQLEEEFGLHLSGRISGNLQLRV